MYVCRYGTHIDMYILWYMIYWGYASVLFYHPLHTVVVMRVESRIEIKRTAALREYRDLAAAASIEQASQPASKHTSVVSMQYESNLLAVFSCARCVCCVVSYSMFHILLLFLCRGYNGVVLFNFTSVFI